jgi:1-deoxy-D-xylulose-5-phosphate reductoisomerase
LVEQAAAVRPGHVVISDESVARQVSPGDFPAGTKLLVGREGLRAIAQAPQVDVVLAAIVGSAGL